MLEFVYVAQLVEDGDVLGVYPDIEAMKADLTDSFEVHSGWQVTPDQREASLGTPVGHPRYPEPLVVAKLTGVTFKESLSITNEVVERPDEIEEWWKMSIPVFFEVNYLGEDCNIVVNICYDSVGSEGSAENSLSHFEVDGTERVWFARDSHVDPLEQLHIAAGNVIDKKFPKAKKQDRDNLCNRVVDRIQIVMEENEIKREIEKWL